MIAFDKLEDGMMLYDRVKRWGSWECYPVKVLSVNREERTALVSWNMNKPRVYTEREFRRLYREPYPKPRVKSA